ncbi:MAG: stage III sporulation protein AB [Oscillospiraceae bacterium]
MKTVLIFIIIIVCTLMGSYFSERLKQKCIFLKEISYMLEELRLLIEFESAEVGEIIQRLMKNQRLSELGFIKNIADRMDVGTDFGSLWENAVEMQQYSFLSSEEKEFIKEIGRKLGKSDINGQINAIKFEKNELENMIRSAADDYCRKAKLYRSLGVLCGAFIAIMFI